MNREIRPSFWQAHVCPIPISISFRPRSSMIATTSPTLSLGAVKQPFFSKESERRWKANGWSNCHRFSLFFLHFPFLYFQPSPLRPVINSYPPVVDKPFAKFSVAMPLLQVPRRSDVQPREAGSLPLPDSRLVRTENRNTEPFACKLQCPNHTVVDMHHCLTKDLHNTKRMGRKKGRARRNRGV